MITTGVTSAIFVFTEEGTQPTIRIANAHDPGTWRELVHACITRPLYCTQRPDGTWRIPVKSTGGSWIQLELDSALQALSVPPAFLGYPYSTRLNTDQADAPGWVVEVRGLPAGLRYDQATDTISGTPTGDTPTTAKVTVTLTTGGWWLTSRVLSTKTVTLQINFGPPQIVTDALPAATPNVYYQRKIEVSSKSNPNVTVSVSGLPSGLSYAPSSGNVLGVPTQSGTFQIEIKATTIHGTTAKTLPLTVDWPTPKISNTVLVEGTVGKSYVNFIATDLSGAPRTGSTMSATGLPPGTYFDGNVWGIGGTPTVAGSYTVQLELTTPNGGTAVRILTLKVNPAP